jgi:hypothetical protein
MEPRRGDPTARFFAARRAAFLTSGQAVWGRVMGGGRVRTICRRSRLAEGSMTQTYTQSEPGASSQIGPDFAARTVGRVEKTVQKSTGASLLHLLAGASIVGSIALFIAGRKAEAIFVGLWPPTFLALRTAVERQNRED